MNLPGTPAEQVAAYCRLAGLPAPEAEVLVAPGVRAWRFDLAWPALLLALEIEGGGFAGKPCPLCKQRPGGRHTSGAGHRGDCEKYTEAALRGWRVMHALPEHVRKGLVWGWLYRALAASARPPRRDPRDECPGHGRGGTREPCCGRAGEYNGFGSDGPTIFTCTKGCSCHD